MEQLRCLKMSETCELLKCAAGDRAWYVLAAILELKHDLTAVDDHAYAPLQADRTPTLWLDLWHGAKVLGHPVGR